MRLILSILTSIAISAAANAASLEHAENDVKHDGSSLKTGEKSSGQLTTSNGVIRVGSKTDVAIRDNENELDLNKGVMLVSSDKAGFGRDKLTVNTPFAQVEAKATMMITYQPGRYIKIACIEGKVDVELKSLAKDKVKLRAGQLLIIHCLENTTPRLFDIDLPTFVGSSPLAGGRFPDLPQVAGLPNRGRPAQTTAAAENQNGAQNQRSQSTISPSSGANALIAANAPNLRINACPPGSLDPACVNNMMPIGRGMPGQAGGAQGQGGMGGGAAPPPGGGMGGGGGGQGGGGQGGPPPPPPPPPPTQTTVRR
ncbi:MAG: FecR domain-containing protein [Verrucomicrobiota bacterium]